MNMEACVNQHRASIVHELNNSLAIIVLQCRLLSSTGSSTTHFGESLEVIQDQALRMKQMVDSLRSPEDPLKPQLETADLNTLVSRTLDIQRPQLQMDGIEVTLDLAADLPATQADPYQLQQVFVNLIKNARQAMEGGPQGAKLSVTTGLSADGNGSGCRIQIRVSDNGPGIPAEVLPHIFEPFFTTKEPGQGTGLGLSICDQIARKHGGNIWAENNADGGAAFVLELPVVEPVAAQERSLPRCIPAAPAGTSMRDRRVLIVDDKPEFCHAARQVLQQAGFQVTTTSEARYALALLDQERFDLLLSDLAMPGMNGREFWKAVTKRHPALAKRIIFITGDSSSRRAHAFLQDCGCAWIKKPFRAGELLRLIGRILV